MGRFLFNLPVMSWLNCCYSKSIARLVTNIVGLFSLLRITIHFKCVCTVCVFFFTPSDLGRIPYTYWNVSWFGFLHWIYKAHSKKWTNLLTTYFSWAPCFHFININSVVWSAAKAVKLDIASHPLHLDLPETKKPAK